MDSLKSGLKSAGKLGVKGAKSGYKFGKSKVGNKSGKSGDADHDYDSHRNRDDSYGARYGDRYDDRDRTSSSYGRPNSMYGANNNSSYGNSAYGNSYYGQPNNQPYGTSSYGQSNNQSHDNTQGGYGQGSYNQGGYNQDSYNQNGYDQSGYDRNNNGQNSYAQSGYNNNQQYDATLQQPAQQQGQPAYGADTTAPSQYGAGYGTTNGYGADNGNVVSTGYGASAGYDNSATNNNNVTQNQYSATTTPAAVSSAQAPYGGNGFTTQQPIPAYNSQSTVDVSSLPPPPVHNDRGKSTPSLQESAKVEPENNYLDNTGVPESERNPERRNESGNSGPDYNDREDAYDERRGGYDDDRRNDRYNDRRDDSKQSGYDNRYDDRRDDRRDDGRDYRRDPYDDDRNGPSSVRPGYSQRRGDDRDYDDRRGGYSNNKSSYYPDERDRDNRRDEGSDRRDYPDSRRDDRRYENEDTYRSRGNSKATRDQPPQQEYRDDKRNISQDNNHLSVGNQSSFQPVEDDDVPPPLPVRSRAASVATQQSDVGRDDTVSTPQTQQRRRSPEPVDFPRLNLPSVASPHVNPTQGQPIITSPDQLKRQLSSVRSRSSTMSPPPVRSRTQSIASEGKSSLPPTTEQNVDDDSNELAHIKLRHASINDSTSTKPTEVLNSKDNEFKKVLETKKKVPPKVPVKSGSLKMNILPPVVPVKHDSLKENVASPVLPVKHDGLKKKVPPPVVPRKNTTLRKAATVNNAANVITNTKSTTGKNDTDLSIVTEENDDNLSPLERYKRNLAAANNS